MIHFIVRLILFLVFICLSLISCETGNKKEVKTEEISFSKDGELNVYQGDSLVVQNLNIEISDDEYERQTGLMYRASMEDNQGMLFVFEDEKPRHFYMKNTEISLDIIYINSDMKVVSIIKNADPMNEASLPSQFPAQYVLEVNGGLNQQWGLKVGDSISFDKS
ncbi:DUF192 domain-containing protein [Galbibacter sp. EGI 63066]|uniref:DUF192 domain-containing protein n=1 Tax=Galbibacter sp. EGI 63066 TaxID=2993559 RepID=UPI002249854B|nr:DUF192 domain-containing protein [Galbibacter sp. EGI 63066]MCX2679581.1 DUF192 domain-containing protein [Galbibacter sp. EGI 63066]